MFPAQVYSNRRNTLLSLLSAKGITSGIILLVGAKYSPMNYRDNHYPFRQDSSFLYYIGLHIANVAAILDLSSAKSTLFIDKPTVEDLIWTGPLPSPEELAFLSGMDKVLPRSALSSKVGNDTCYFFPPYREDTALEIAALTHIKMEHVWNIQSTSPCLAHNTPLITCAIAQREIKSKEELAELEKALVTTQAMHRTVMQNTKIGMTEKEVGNIAVCKALETGGLSFPVIATTRSEILHSLPTSRKIQSGDLVLLDAGAQSNEFYAADLSTTFPASPRFTTQQRIMYELVLSMQKAACMRLTPGQPFIDLHFAAALEAVKGLTSLGLMQGDCEEAVQSGAYAFFFPCGLGHMIGLDVHDMESYGEDFVGYSNIPRSSLFGLKYLRLAKCLLAGMTLTIEPGIYFIPELYEQWKAEKKYTHFINYTTVKDWIGQGGVRNEENWVITNNGATRLGPIFNKDISSIEAARMNAL